MKLDDIDAAALARAREIYFAGTATVAEIAAELGLDARGFVRLRTREGWPLRQRSKVAARRKAKPSRVKSVPKRTRPESPPQPPGPPADPAQLEQRLADAVSRELATFEGGEGRAPRTDRNARILSSLAKTLAELRKLEATPKPKGRKGQEPHGPVDPPPRDVAALRADIARRLAEYRRSREPG